ncbi:MAG: AAA family ATPase [Pseudomonadota bacterium]
MAKYAPLLIQNGYTGLVPIKHGTKYPAIKGWQKEEFPCEELLRLAKSGHSGIGLRTEHFPAIDIDVLDERVADRLLQESAKRHGQSVERIGCKPKRLLFFKTDTPFSKITSSTWLDGSGRQHKVEVLGAGQQAVAYGIHPGTQEPYRYPHQELAEVHASALARLDREEGRAFCEFFDSVAEDAGWKRLSSSVHGGGLEGDAGKNPLTHFRPRAGVTVTEMGATLEALAEFRSDQYHPWCQVLMAIHHETAGSPDGLELAHEFSARSSKYDSASVDTKWASFNDQPDRPPLTYASIVRWAQYDRARSTIHCPGLFTPSQTAAFFGTEPPQRQWLDGQEMIPARGVTLLYGAGGTGKSMIAAQLAYAVATGGDWLGSRVQRSGQAFYISCEDDEDELHRRFKAIREADVAGHARAATGFASQVTAPAFPEDQLHHYVGLDAPTHLAVAAPDGGVTFTEAWKALTHVVQHEDYRLLILDTLVDFYAADMMSPAPVAQFLTKLQGFANANDLAILLLAHPSKGNVEGDFGSITWSGKVRSRLLFERELNGADQQEKDPNARQLRVMKANYSERGRTLPVGLDTDAMVFRKTSADDRLPATPEQHEEIFLELLDITTRRGDTVSPKQSSAFAPTVFARMEEARGISKNDLEGAMNRLRDRKAIEVVQKGPPSRRTSVLQRAD